jgi:hypothetical protein
MPHVFTEPEKQLLRSEGALVGLEKLAQRTPGLNLDDWRSGWLGYWMQSNLKEADTELAKLGAALARLKAGSQMIENKKRVSAKDPAVTQFLNDLDAVDGWTISLLETVLSIVAFLNTQKANQKVSQLNTAMQSLMARRQSESDPFLKDPSLFKGYMG